jgi:hypothetical protein
VKEQTLANQLYKKLIDDDLTNATWLADRHITVEQMIHAFTHCAMCTRALINELGAEPLWKMIKHSRSADDFIKQVALQNATNTLVSLPTREEEEMRAERISVAAVYSNVGKVVP